jgi:hypothetical protein
MSNKEVVVFKSIPENYEKEKKGLKKVTIREDDGGPRFVMLREWMKTKDYGYVCIMNSVTYEAFLEPCSDVSEFNGLYLTSWK